jgi:hypothetical protein
MKSPTVGYAECGDQKSLVRKRRGTFPHALSRDGDLKKDSPS